MKSIRLLLLLSFAIAFGQTTPADVFRISQIVGYNTGNLGADAMTGQQDQWFVVGNAGSITVTNGSGSLDGTALGLAQSAGDKVFIGTNNSINASRNQFAAGGTFPQTVEISLYYSFLYRFKSAPDVSPDGEVMIRVNRANSGTGTAQHWDLLARNDAGKIQLGIAKANGIVNYAPNLINEGETFFVVVRQHIIPGTQNDIYDLWINPPPASFGTNEVDVPTPNASVGADPNDGAEDQSGTGPGRFVIGSGLNAEFDEFRVTSSWAEATPWVGQCVAAAVAQHPSDVTQSAEISATFKVTAEGSSPTIQWQRSTNSGQSWEDIPGATAASYTTPPLLMSDNGNQYRAVVTTACDGSKATSSAATVTLTAPAETAVGVVMNDTFLDPDLGFDDRANPPVTPSNSVWYTAVTDNLTAFGQGGNMVGTPISGSSSLWLGYFVEAGDLPVHLAVGRALKVTLPFTPSSYGFFTANSRLRIGLFDYFDGGVRITADGSAAGGSRGNGRGVRGYMLNLDFGPTFGVNTPLQILARTFLDDDNLMGSIGSYNSFGSGPEGAALTGTPAFEAGTEYTLEFLVARTGINAIDVTTTITGGGNSWSHTITDTTYAYRRFDSFGLRVNSLETSADSFTFPEFRVEVIDAPVSLDPFPITSVQRVAPDSIKLTWDSQAGVSYQVLSTPSLPAVVWTTNATIVAEGISTSYTESTSGSARFYRISAQR